MSELGETLKNVREEKGISLAELQEITKIQKRYLLAIERGDYGQLPGRFYARAFIKSYAEAVGIDPDPLFEQYNNEIPKPQNEAIPSLPSRTERRVSGQEKVSRPSGTSRRTSAVWPSILAAIVIVGVLVIIWMAFQHAHKGGQGAVAPSNSQVKYQQNKTSQKKQNKNKQNNKTSDNQKKTTSSSNDNKKQNKKKAAPQPVLTKTGQSNGVTNYTLKKANQVQLKMDVTGGDCWIAVKKDGASGKRVIYKIVKSGTKLQQDLSGTKQLYIRLGNASRVKTFIDNIPVNYPSTNTVQTFMITVDNTKNAS